MQTVIPKQTQLNKFYRYLATSGGPEVLKVMDYAVQNIKDPAIQLLYITSQIPVHDFLGEHSTYAPNAAKNAANAAMIMGNNIRKAAGVNRQQSHSLYEDSATASPDDLKQIVERGKYWLTNPNIESYDDLLAKIGLASDEVIGNGFKPEEKEIAEAVKAEMSKRFDYTRTVREGLWSLKTDREVVFIASLDSFPLEDTIDNLVGNLPHDIQ